jgi:3-methyl-2-oxobutanoate hydroxymethyltransferase
MRLTIRDIQKLKSSGEKLVMITAYDASSARLSEAAGAPLLLVGDSLGMVIQGHDSTIPVTLEHMIYHCEIVNRVTTRPLIVGDLPFMTYSISPEQAMRSAARLVQKSGVQAVKIEGGESVATAISRLTHAGIPVMAHLGLTPQSVNQFGGFRVQGREIDSARPLIRDALLVQESGAFAVVLELVPAPLAALISDLLDIPTIGIGAGAGCDGQVQVFHDLLTLAGDFQPRHAHRYTDAGTAIQTALAQYVAEVKAGAFPTDQQSFTMNDELIAALRGEFQGRA